MRTLFIEYIYLSGNSGGIYASRTHINLFAELSEELTLIYPTAKGKELEGVNTEKISKLVPIEDHRSNPKKFLDLFSGKVHRTQNLSDEYFDKNKYDIVVFDNSVVSSGLVKRFKKAGIKTITIHHNYQIEYLKGNGNKWFLPFNLFWTHIYERGAVKNSDLNLTLTKQDADLLKLHYSDKADFAVIGVFEYEKKTPIKLTESNRGFDFVITGYLGARQTEDSLISWIQTYWPLLKDIKPEAKLTIAGKSPSDRLTSVIKSAGITLIPSPKDMLPILMNADYYICPTDCGGGIKLRILDGLKVGLPVLSHVISARGYEKIMDRCVLFTYSNIDEFEEGLKQLLKLRLTNLSIQQEYLQLYNFECGVSKLSKLLSNSGIML